MRSICFVVFYLLISFIRYSSGNLKAKNESVDLLMLDENKDNFNINITLNESTSLSNRSLYARRCGSVLTAPNGTFTSPNFPNDYDNNLDCKWLIELHPDERILLSFQEIHVERSTWGCPYDVIDVYDGADDKAPRLGHFCGFDAPDDFKSSSNQLFVTFKTDEYHTFKGFVAKYRTIFPSCGGNLTSLNGTFTTPEFPNDYENCEWLIQAPPDKRLLLTFQEFNLVDSTNCSLDAVEVYDGANDIANLLGYFCGGILPRRIFSSKNELFVRLKSNHSVPYKSFKGEYQITDDQNCGEVLTSPTGTFTSPNFPDDYDSNLNCGWLIRLQPNRRIVLTFLEFELEGSPPGCSRDAVEVYDGADDTDLLLGRFCGKDVPNDLFSSKNQLFVRFKSDYSGTNRGFKAEYRTRCGGNYTEKSYTLTSPNYPDKYPRNAQCIYEIRLEPGNVVNLTFHMMDIEIHPSCDLDYLQIRDGDNENSPLIATLCGSHVPEPIVSTSNSLWMKFESDHNLQFKGFNATYNAIRVDACDCGINGTCKLVNGGKVCSCDTGYIQYNGECKLCDCGINGKCSFNYLKEPKCVCDDGYAIHNGKCNACDCGKNSTRCSFNDLKERLCLCKDGFVAKRDSLGNEFCKDCDCGINEKCVLNNGVKRCLCSTGLREINGKCQECDCGYNAVNCELDNYKYKKCTCKDGYYAYRHFSRMDDECSSCNCGKNSIGCYLNKRKSKYCKCKYGNVTKDSLQKCKECDCGSGGKTCDFTRSGKTQCTCYTGYEIQNNYETGDYCSLKDSSSYGSHGWKIATLVISVVFVVIVIGTLRVVVEKRGILNKNEETAEMI